MDFTLRSCNLFGTRVVSVLCKYSLLNQADFKTGSGHRVTSLGCL